MSIVIFSGPTLAADEIRRELDAVVLPPAAQGDVYRAALERPAAIGIIDGYFERVPSVSHKEILWAMSQGIHVFGAASMGALRAAELAMFGMEGVGWIYEAYARGEIDADDEVTVAHAAAEDGYRQVSEPLVNIRATLRAAEEAGVISACAREALVRAARGLFYVDRGYPLLLAGARKEGLPAAELDALRAFLPEGRVDQKRLDGLAMLRTIRERAAAGLAPKRVAWHFEHTDAWEHIRGNAEQGAAALEARPTDPAVEALQRSGGHAAARRGALGRALAIEAARRQNRVIQGAALQDAVEAFRRARGLARPEDLERWLDEQGVVDREAFFRDEAHVQWAEILYGGEADRCMADHLRSTGEYAALAAESQAETARAQRGHSA